MGFNKLKIGLAWTLVAGTLCSHALHAAEPVKEWTVMIFLNGHNNLDHFGHEDINEMEKVGSTQQVNVVVQWASLQNGNTQRLLIKKDQDESEVKSPVIQTMPAVDMGDYKKLAEFMKWTAKNYPAKRYFVGVWNHGAGWRGIEPVSRNITRATTKGISYDDLSGNYITTSQLRLAFEDFYQSVGRRVDVIGADACLMGMAEVAYELRNHADYFVASQELEAGDGWPYDTWLNLFRSLKDNSSKVMAESLVKAYNFSYRPDSNVTRPDADATLSAINLKRMGILSNEIKSFAAAVVSDKTVSAYDLAESAFGAASFSEQDYRDLNDVVKRIKTVSKSSEVQKTGNALMKGIRETVILSRRQETHKDTRGLAIWLPDSYMYSTFRADYVSLQFHQASNWANVIEFLIQ